MMKEDALKHIGNIIWVLFILIATALMYAIVIPYTSWGLDVDFLITKQHIIHLDYYRIAFYCHIFSSLIVLFCGVVLFLQVILKYFPKLHRMAGKIYVALLLFIAAPSGMVMAFHANGGWMVQLSFLILTPLWWWCTYKGYQTIREKKVKVHRQWMIRSYALTLSAISLRVYQLLLGYYCIVNPEYQYVIVSWGSWIGNIILAEVLIRWRVVFKMLFFNEFLRTFFYRIT